jgi:uncharacterized protein YwgA
MVDENFSKLCSIWNSIGPFNMDLFRDRLLLQKKIFLLQESGEDLGYKFGIYLRGPYSSSLATAGYKMNASENISSELNPTIIEKIKIVNLISEGHENDAPWFELVATIAFYSKKQNKTKEEIKKVIFETKPHLANEELFEQAYRKLITLNFINVQLK